MGEDHWGEPNCHKILVIAVPGHWAVLRFPVAEIHITVDPADESGDVLR